MSEQTWPEPFDEKVSLAGAWTKAALERVAWNVVGVHAGDVHPDERLSWGEIAEALAPAPSQPTPGETSGGCLHHCGQVAP